MEPKKTGKRIVSKGKYVGRMSKKAGLSSFGLILFYFSFIAVPGCCCVVLLALGKLMSSGPGDSNIIGTVLILMLAVVFGTSAFVGGYLGIQTFKKAEQIDAGIPLTRANAADLPAEESLVRASKESTLEQQAVLLRAASQGQVTPAEELVRPTIGP